MWFAADSTWKLIDLGCASGVDDWTLVSDVTGNYAAPEVQFAHRHGRQRILMEPEADMWSFGVIAFETLTGLGFALCARIMRDRYCPGRTFVDWKRVQKGVANFIWASPSATAEYDHRWLFADPGGRRSGSDEQRYRRFLRKMLCKNPKDRVTAADALGDTLFRNVEASWQRSYALVQVRRHLTLISHFLAAFLTELTQRPSDRSFSPGTDWCSVASRHKGGGLFQRESIRSVVALERRRPCLYR